jgi:hypothetical protein
LSPALREAIEAGVKRTGHIQGWLILFLCALYSLIPGTLIVAVIANVPASYQRGDMELQGVLMAALMLAIALVPTVLLGRWSLRFLREAFHPMASRFAQALLHPETIKKWEAIEVRYRYGNTVVIRVRTESGRSYVRLGRNAKLAAILKGHLAEHAPEARWR